MGTSPMIYKKFMFAGVIYSIGEFAMFRETQKSTIVGRILRIIEEGGCKQHPKQPMIQVQWYYKKSDLDMSKLGISEQDREFIGENELFPTMHHDKVFADTIVSKCQVYSIKQYDDLESIDFNTTYFTRATYCPLSKELEPTFSEWDRLCICQKPLNPNLLHIKCDLCGNWFHPKCMGLSNERIENLEDFFCENCEKKLK